MPTELSVELKLITDIDAAPYHLRIITPIELGGLFHSAERIGLVPSILGYNQTRGAVQIHIQGLFHIKCDGNPSLPPKIFQQKGRKTPASRRRPS